MSWISAQRNAHFVAAAISFVNQQDQTEPPSSPEFRLAQEFAGHTLCRALSSSAVRNLLVLNLFQDERWPCCMKHMQACEAWLMIVQVIRLKLLWKQQAGRTAPERPRRLHAAAQSGSPFSSRPHHSNSANLTSPTLSPSVSAASMWLQEAFNRRAKYRSDGASGLAAKTLGGHREFLSIPS